LNLASTLVGNVTTPTLLSRKIPVSVTRILKFNCLRTTVRQNVLATYHSCVAESINRAIQYIQYVPSVTMVHCVKKSVTVNNVPYASDQRDRVQLDAAKAGKEQLVINQICHQTKQNGTLDVITIIKRKPWKSQILMGKPDQRLQPTRYSSVERFVLDSTLPTQELSIRTTVTVEKVTADTDKAIYAIFVAQLIPIKSVAATMRTAYTQFVQMEAMDRTVSVDATV
jgi:hypothetical protein